MKGSGRGVAADPVRALQHAPYRAAKADPRLRFHALYDRTCRSDVLWRVGRGAPEQWRAGHPRCGTRPSAHCSRLLLRLGSAILGDPATVEDVRATKLTLALHRGPSRLWPPDPGWGARIGCRVSPSGAHQIVRRRRQGRPADRSGTRHDRAVFSPLFTGPAAVHSGMTRTCHVGNGGAPGHSRLQAPGQHEGIHMSTITTDAHTSSRTGTA